jgi:cardiolipin-specific phospholipase
VIVLHGFGSGLGFFFATLPHMAATGRTIYLIDWLGCGGSERPVVKHCAPGMNADFFNLPLKDWMTAEGISKADIVGHSLGGLISKEFSDKFPERVSRLVLASPAGFGGISPSKTSSESFSRQLLDMMWSSNITPQQVVRLAGRQRGHALVTRAVHGRFANSPAFNVPLLADYLYEITVAHPSGEYALNALLSPPFQAGAVVARRPITQFSGNFPVNVIFGDRDWLGTASAVENAKKVADKVSIMKGATHHLYMDNPVEFAKLCTS